MPKETALTFYEQYRPSNLYFLALQPKILLLKLRRPVKIPCYCPNPPCVPSSLLPLLSTLTVSRGNLGKREKMNTKTEQKHQGKEKKESEEETREEERRREQRSDEEEREDKTSKEKKRGRERRRGGKRREEEERRGEMIGE